MEEKNLPFKPLVAFSGEVADPDTGEKYTETCLNRLNGVPPGVAIEENFILDVLKNYTTFKRYFKLIKTIPTDDEYEKKKAIRLLTSDVDLSDHAIEQKTRTMLDHFLEKTLHAVQGKGRAMVVTRSRLHAVRFYLAFSKVMQEKNLPFKPLVAFSGEVTDPDTGAKHTENSLNHIPALP